MRQWRAVRSTFVVVSAVWWCAVAAAQTGVQVNTDSNGQNIVDDAANEPTLAISPVNPGVMVIGWRQFPTISSDSRYAGYAYSRDGGATWINGGTLDPPPNKPPNSEQTDPVLAVDADGAFYYWSEVFRPNPPTSHHVYRSDDGGMTWDIPTQVQEPAVAGDKEWMVIDRTGGMGDGHIYGGWSKLEGTDHHVFVRSTDGGQTFSEPVRIADRGGRQFMLHFAVAPHGELYAAWRHYSSNSIYVTKSTNVNDPNVTPTFDALGSGGVNGLDVKIDDGNDPGFISLNPSGFHQIWLGVNYSDTDSRGDVYCMWADDRNDTADIYLARSTDGGFTWQTGMRVNDDPVGSGAVQWMVAMDVAPNGRIDAAWYDTRDDPQHELSALYYSFSTDGGLSWSPNERLSDAFDTTVGFPVQQKIGDYTQIISLDGSVNIAYAATFNGEQDVWFMRVMHLFKGDLNCDGAFNGADIDPFFLALGDPAAYAAQFPNCNILNGDMNGDGRLDGADIDPFFACLGGNCP
ncbi:MAG: hypothetical protein IH989_07020 [Planctomycetes bacterium]|nr:hypothetical protein [Planctomycetota bacterium]